MKRGDKKPKHRFFYASYMLVRNGCVTYSSFCLQQIDGEHPSMKTMEKNARMSDGDTLVILFITEFKNEKDWKSWIDGQPLKEAVI